MKDIVGVINGNRERTHGQTGSPTYSSWKAMRARCQNPNAHRYESYGGRGITVCERWQDFDVFLADMGERPEGSTLDRIDNNGPYSPENCRWATQAEQIRNRNSGLHSFTIDGKTQCLTDWAVQFGIPRSVVYHRVNRLHWPIEKALSTPVKAYSSRKR
jgi:hypothetical protein